MDIADFRTFSCYKSLASKRQDGSDSSFFAETGELRRLAASAGFRSLSPAEEKILNHAPTGSIATCGPNLNSADPENNPKGAENWGEQRQIRSDLLVWLISDQHAGTCIHPKGVQVYGAKIIGNIDLASLAIAFPKALERCRIEDINLNDADIPTLNFSGSVLRGMLGQQLTVSRVLVLRETLASGAVSLPYARVGNDFDCSSANFSGSGDYALNATRMNVGGSVYLSTGFVSQGRVLLIGPKIAGDLDCRGGTFDNPGGSALDADRADIGGNVYLSYVRRGSGENSFESRGEVNFTGARIDGQLACSGATFSNQSGSALALEHAAIRGTLLLNDGFTAQGIVDLSRAQVGEGFNLSGGNFQNAFLLLLDASTETFTDSGLDTITDEYPATVWPRSGGLLLDGFRYGRISSGGAVNVQKRLEWLGLQPKSPFQPQPYAQLAKTLRESGDTDGADYVLERAEELRRQDTEHGPVGG